MKKYKVVTYARTYGYVKADSVEEAKAKAQKITMVGKEIKSRREVTEIKDK